LERRLSGSGGYEWSIGSRSVGGKDNMGSEKETSASILTLHTLARNLKTPIRGEYK
jgi:hypothetical protein